MAVGQREEKDLAAAPLAARAALWYFFAVILCSAAAVVVAVAAAAAPQAPGQLLFDVGGPRGWRVPDANTSYGWWAMNNRFHVGDALYFKYKNDSVLVVDRQAFDGCNTTKPIATFTDGATTVPLVRPGFFCFISGELGHCEDGQRLVVRVMVHPPEVPAAAAPGPGPAYAPATSPPGHSGDGGSPGSGSRAHPVPHVAPSGAAVVASGDSLAAATAFLAGVVVMLQ